MTNTKGGTGDGPYGIKEPVVWFYGKILPV